VYICFHSWLKYKNPTAVGQWGSLNLVNESEPDRRAAKQRVQQQVQIQIAIHAGKLAAIPDRVKWFLNRRFPD